MAIQRDDEWQLVSPDDASEDTEEGLPVYNYVQRNARFWGAELEAIWHLHENTDSQLDLRFAADLTRARAGSRNLPRIPAARLTAGVLWATDAWSAGAECQWVLAQRRVAPQETTSDGYALASAHVSRAITFGHVRWEIFLRGTNLADKEARPHTSFVKELAPLAGRAITAGMRVAF
jgi:iron complex outermembrane receptor protein